MRSLALKLTLAFLLVGLIGAMLMAFFVWRNTERRFDQFVVDRDRASFVTLLVQHYRANGNWNGVEEVFENGRFQAPEPYNHHAALVLVDVNGTVVFSQGDNQAINQSLERDRGRGVPIIVDGNLVGWLRSVPLSQSPRPDSPEARFLADTTRAILYSAIGATVIALLLGILLARTLTRPIRELTLVTRVLAKGDLGQQVSVRTRDELGQLAASFNQMSAELARASELRRQMTADIAHELRTPLSLILGYTESLSDGKLPATQETFDIMHDEAQHLSRVIDDLRTLSLADAGELPLARRPVDPRTLLERAMSAHSPEAQQRDIAIQVETPSDLPQVEVDPGRMAQVLENLVNNALRYTPEGGRIVLSVEANAGTIKLRVQDNGVGIAAEDLPYIFDRFYRSEKSRPRQGTESGLGLAIAKSIVEAHGGSLWVESALGEGTTFTIALPAI
ncbi:MAG: HAMP domain-containing sensor histidine kinase [Anaerolineae bacterium]